jgi:GNAT superfamily N-acetyltransferase
VPADHLAGLDVAARADRWRRTLSEPREPRAGVLVAEVDAEVVGFVRVGPSRDPEADGAAVGELMGLYVLPEMIGGGVGRDLMAAAVERLVDARFGRATLWVLEGNDRAIGFYQRAGWTADGARKTIEIGGAVIPEVRYWRELPQRGQLRDFWTI